MIFQQKLNTEVTITSKYSLFVFLPFIITACGLMGNQGDTTIRHLSAEFLKNPLGVDTKHPRFSWNLESGKRNVHQKAYQILVASSPKLLTDGSADMWNSQKTDSVHTVNIIYNGKELKSNQTYYWKVKVWDNNGIPSGWSQPSEFTTGLFRSNDWGSARWIGYETLPDSMRVVPGVHGNGSELGARGKRRPVIPYFRKAFKSPKRVDQALLYISGLGQYEAYINGQKVGDQFLSPGWTDYDKTVYYNAYDVTELINEGQNVIGAIVGNGFYNINRERYRKLVIAYGMPKMICRLVVKYGDGSVQNVYSNTEWKTSASPILFSSIYGGEDYDARREQPGWDQTGFDDIHWKQAMAVDAPQGELKAQENMPVKVEDTLKVKRISQPKSGTYIYDFGQNASGIIRLKTQGKKGQQIRLTPAELLNEQGLANQNASGKPYYYTYTLKGDDVESWQPRFSYYGFRYVQIDNAVPDTSEGMNKQPKIENLQFLHTRNSAPRTGHFSTSDTLFNRIYDLINWAIKSNFQSVITDCPHREKLGWLEQTHLMGGSIHYNYRLHHLYRKLIHDMMDAQTPEGLVPDIVPEYVEFQGGFRDSPEWGSASVLLPWLVYRWYGDRRIMQEAWPLMAQYVNYLKRKSNHHILSFGLGDWFDLGPKFPGEAQLTPKALTATAIYYYDVKLLSRIARILNKPEEGAHYKKQAKTIKQAFNKNFFNKDKKIYSTGSQTAMAMPLVVGLADSASKQKVVANLTDSIRVNGKALTAGDIGFHYLIKALQDNGASRLIYAMNSRTDVPGYGYQLKKGATSLTESWAALKEVSNNHLMLGHLMQWFYEGLAGIKQADDSKGYDHIIFEPNFVGDIRWVKADYASPHGRVASEWHISDQKVMLDVEVPVNATGTVIIPSGKINGITESGRLIEKKSEVRVITKDSTQTSIRIGSGEYHFEFRK